MRPCELPFGSQLTGWGGKLLESFFDSSAKKVIV